MDFTFLAQTPTPEHHSSLYYLLVSAFYGVVEGITEFLPISSTAHLRLVEGLTPGIDLESGYWKMYSVVIQLGAILSVPLLFWDRLMAFTRSFPRGEQGDKRWFNHPISLVLLGFFVTAGPCYLADKYISKNLENLWIIAFALLFGGIVMWVVDAMCKRPTVERVEHMKPLDAVWVGLVQILSATFPGTSRSMSTIAAGQVFGLSRATALEFSFFLSIPVMFSATAYKLLQALVKRPKNAVDIAIYNAPPSQWLVLAVGFIVSFIVAYLVNRWFINWVKRRGFAPFAIYRVLLGVAIIVALLSFPGLFKEKKEPVQQAGTPAAQVSVR